MTHFPPPGFNPSRANFNVPQQNQQTDAPAPEAQTSVPVHHGAGPSGMQQEERPQSPPSAAVAHHERERFLQWALDVARNAAPDRRFTLINKQKFMNALVPYEQGEQMSKLGKSSGFSMVNEFLYDNGMLNRRGVELYDNVLTSAEQARTMEALENRKRVLAERKAAKEEKKKKGKAVVAGPSGPGSSSGIQLGKRLVLEFQTASRQVRQRMNDNAPSQVLLQFAPSTEQTTSHLQFMGLPVRVDQPSVVHPDYSRFHQQLPARAAPAQVDPVEQEWNGILPNMPSLAPDMPELTIGANLILGSGDLPPHIAHQIGPSSVSRRTDGNAEGN